MRQWGDIFVDLLNCKLRLSVQLRPLHDPAELPPEPHCRIFLLGEDGRFPVAEFLNHAADAHPHEFEKLNALLDRCCRDGIPNNREKVRSLGDGLYEFKTGGGLRIFWFWDAGHMVICAHGILKKSQKTPPKDRKIARDRKAAYEAAKRKQQVEILPP